MHVEWLSQQGNTMLKQLFKTFVLTCQALMACKKSKNAWFVILGGANNLVFSIHQETLRFAQGDISGLFTSVSSPAA
jgi:hypothetical protein